MVLKMSPFIPLNTFEYVLPRTLFQSIAYTSRHISSARMEGLTEEMLQEFQEAFYGQHGDGNVTVEHVAAILKSLDFPHDLSSAQVRINEFMRLTGRMSDAMS